MMNGVKYKKNLDIDAILPVSAISVETAREFESEVWGQGFLEPAWYGMFTVVEASLMGNDKHLRMKLNKDGKDFNAVQFFNDFMPEVNTKIGVAYKLNVNEFRGEENIQLMIIDKEEK